MEVFRAISQKISHCWLIGFLRSLNFSCSKQLNYKCKYFKRHTSFRPMNKKSDSFHIKLKSKSCISGGLDPWVLLSMDFKVIVYKNLENFLQYLLSVCAVCGGGYHNLLFMLPSSWKTVRNSTMY